MDTETQLGLTFSDPVFLRRARDGACIKDMPIETTPSITFSAASVTVSRSAPCSAKAPAILCTKSVPATPRTVAGLAMHVVVNDDHTDFKLLPRPFGGQTKVQPVTCVVLDDKKTTGSPRDGENAGQHRVTDGDANTSPQTAAVNMPWPTKPAWLGSCPDRRPIPTRLWIYPNPS